MGKFSIVMVILVISITITIGSVESADAVDILKFDQLHFIIKDHTDVISFIDADNSDSALNSVSVTLTSQTPGSPPVDSKPFQLNREPGTQIFRTIVKFSTTCTLPCPLNELKVVIGNTVTLSKSGSSDDTVIVKSNTGQTPSPLYGNNKFTTTAADCNNSNHTPPPLGDIDNDGICDGWEASGTLSITYPSGIYTPTGGLILERNGPSHLNNQKDIYLEIDYMQGHRPNVEAIWDVIDAFETMGITLHVQLDDEDTSTTNKIPHADCTRWPGLNYPASKGFDQIAGSYFGTLGERVGDWNTNGWIRKHQVFHYALFADKQCNSGSSGVGEVGGNEFMVTLGVLTEMSEPVSPDQIAGTLMHELGHNLNLNHGGNFNDPINCKPTHMSVMSYSRQWSDLISDRNLEYSRQAVGTYSGSPIIESSLNEGNGIGTYIDPAERIVWGPTPPLILVPTAVGVPTIDWNQINDIEGAINPQDLNHIESDGQVVCPGGSTNEDLTGNDDVADLVFNIRADGDWADGRPIGAGGSPAAWTGSMTDNQLRFMESPFCIPVQTILSLAPAGASAEEIRTHFDSFRSCAGGRGETNSTLILQAYQNATLPKGAVLDIGKVVEPIPSSDELSAENVITMRLSRIDSIMVYLQHNTIDKDFTNADKNENLKFYQGETDAIKKSIINHRLLDVLDQLTTLYDSYSNRVTDNDKLSDLKKGTLDIYNSINKAVLGPSMIVDGKVDQVDRVVQVVQNGKINPVFIAELMILHPDLFDDDREIKTDYKTFIKNGNLLVSEWKIVKKGEEVRDDPMYLKPRQMLKFVDKIDVVCNEGLVKLDKPDGKSVVCVKESTKEKLGAIWGTSKTIMTQN